MKVILLYLLVFLASCGPVQGYLGPERPESEIATVYYDPCDANLDRVQASSQGVAFTSSGITLLPGKRSFDVSVERPSKPYDCIPEVNFDESGYRRCLKRQAEAISSNDDFIPSCPISEYQNTSYRCQQDFSQYICELTASVKATKKYNICAKYTASSKVNSSFQEIGGNYRRSGACAAVGQETRTVNRSTPY